MCARACGEMRQLLVRFGVSDGSFVAGGQPLPLPSPEPPSHLFFLHWRAVGGGGWGLSPSILAFQLPG